MKLKLIEKRQELSDVTSFIWEAPEPITWKAGQYMLYKIPDIKMDDRKDKRYFSISHAPHEKNVRITARYAGDKSSSFKKDLFALEVGATIEAEGPGGMFTVEDPNQEFVFIAGGIGITALRPIIMDLDYRKLPININLIYANRSPESVVFKDDLEAVAARNSGLKIRYVFDPQRIDEEMIKKLVPNLDKPFFYVSGPEPMVEAMFKILEGLGLPKERIKRDYYPGYNWP